MSDIISFDEHKNKRDSAQGRADIHDRSEKKEKAEKEARVQSHQAWASLKHNRKLTSNDRITFARRLHREVENLLRARSDLKKWHICEKAGFTDKFTRTSQELSHLTLPMDSDVRNRRLRSTTAPYRDLIKALADLSGKNLFRLVDEITIGTAIHPLHAYLGEGTKSVDSPEVLLATLYEAIDRLDRQYGIYEAYKKTAEIVALRAKRGSTVNWPFSPPIEDDRSNTISDINDAFWRHKWTPEICTNNHNEMVTTSETSYLQPEGDFLPYVPHVYLGTQYTFDYLVTLTWSRSAWPYPDSCGADCPCDTCKGNPCMQWERGCEGPWLGCLEEESRKNEKERAARIMGKRLLACLNEPLRIQDPHKSINESACLSDGRTLNDVYEALAQERIKLFEECDLIIHPHQASEFIKYMARYPEDWSLYKEMLYEVRGLVNTEYKDDYQEFCRQFEQSRLKAASKEQLRDILDDMGSELDLFKNKQPSAVWLIIYPDSELNGLVPAIYSRTFDGEQDLVVLNTRLFIQMMNQSLSYISDSPLEGIIGADGQRLNLAERIRELIVGEDDFVIHKEWKRTAEFIKHNPVLAQVENEVRRLEAFLNNPSDELE